MREEIADRGGIRSRVSRWSDAKAIHKRMVVEAIFGDYALGAFEPLASPRLILVARKGDGRADRLAA